MFHVDDPDKVLHHVNLFLRCGLHFHVLNAIKSVTHDGNEEVHRDDLGDKGGQEEENPG